MASNIVGFEIQADDVERARRFYQRVFGWRFEPWGPPDFYRIQTGTGAEPGIRGSLAKRHQPAGERAPSGYECTIAVDDLATTKNAIVAEGGKLLVDEHEIVGVGRSIRFEDTEGNVACAMTYVERRREIR